VIAMYKGLSDRRGLSSFFWVLAAALLFYKLGATTPWQSEDRWLEIAREMVLSGDYFTPTINGTIYFDKPLASYWLELLVATVTGGVNELAMRAPSALSALVALWATIDLGRRLWSEKTGALAGWILLTCFGFLQWGRLGEADMENLAITIAAVGWYWSRRDNAPSFFNYMVFYLLIAVGAQFKGLTAVVVPVLALLADIVTEQRWRRHLNGAHVSALLVAAAVYLLPFIFAASHPAPHATMAATEPSGLGLVMRENIVRYFAPFDHTEPIYTYLIAIPQYMFPWSPVVIAALIACTWKKFRIEPNVRWVFCALAFIFLFFSLSGSRRNYYILPILPYCALLSARFLSDPQFSRLRSWALKISISLLTLVGLLQAVIPLLLPHLQRRIGAVLPQQAAWLCLAIGLLGLCALAGLYWWRRKHADAAIVAIIGSTIIFWGGLFFWQQPLLDTYRSEAPFARALKPLAAQLAAADIAIYRERPLGRLLYYSEVQLPIRQLDNPEQLQQFIETPPYPKLVLVATRYKDELPEILRNRTPDLVEQSYAWEKKTDDKMLAWRITARPE